MSRNSGIVDCKHTQTLRAYEVLARVLVILATDLDLNPALLENVFHQHRVINYKQSQGQNRWMLYADFERGEERGPRLSTSLAA